MSMLSLSPLPSVHPELDPVAQAGPPRAFACIQCHTRITHTAQLVSTSYRGHAGKAALFSDIQNVVLDPPSILLMDSGAYTIQEFICVTCETYLGWKFVRAHDLPEQWKERHFILELDCVEQQEVDDPEDRVNSSSRALHGLHGRTMSASGLRPPTPKNVREGYRSLQAHRSIIEVEEEYDNGGSLWKPR